MSALANLSKSGHPPFPHRLLQLVRRYHDRGAVIPHGITTPRLFILSLIEGHLPVGCFFSSLSASPCDIARIGAANAHGRPIFSYFLRNFHVVFHNLYIDLHSCTIIKSKILPGVIVYKLVNMVLGCKDKVAAKSHLFLHNLTE